MNKTKFLLFFAPAFFILLFLLFMHEIFPVVESENGGLDVCEHRCSGNSRAISITQIENIYKNIFDLKFEMPLEVQVPSQFELSLRRCAPSFMKSVNTLDHTSGFQSLRLYFLEMSDVNHMTFQSGSMVFMRGSYDVETLAQLSVKHGVTFASISQEIADFFKITCLPCVVTVTKNSYEVDTIR